MSIGYELGELSEVMLVRELSLCRIEGWPDFTRLNLSATTRPTFRDIVGMVEETGKGQVELREVLVDLSSADEPWYVRADIAGCISEKYLSLFRVLARDPVLAVRVALVWNPSTPVKVLVDLAQDADEVVRYGVAANDRTPRSVIAKLAHEDTEKSATVRVKAMQKGK